MPPDAPAYPYRQWEDVFRQQWRWDTVGRSSHFVNCWYQSHCAWNVYVKDGVVWREEQAADYPRVRTLDGCIAYVAGRLVPAAPAA